MRLIVRFKRLHKWFALLVGIQLILWIVSGIAFSFIDHDQVNGDFIFAESYNKRSKPLTQLVDFQRWANKYPTARQIRQFNLDDRNMVEVIRKQQSQLFNADSMEAISVDKSMINNIVKASYQGGGIIKSTQLTTIKTDENRTLALPIWEVAFDDQYATSLYFSSTTGEYRGVRTNSWRLNDFFLMLHFIDYGQRGDFNHWLIIFAAAVLVFFSMSGMLLVYSSFSKEDLSHIINHIFSRHFIKLTIIDEQGGGRILKVEKGERLMGALEANGIELDSVCGGGGICGCCRIKQLCIENKGIENNPALANLSNHDTLSEDELRQGYRLACQLTLDSDITIQI
ncbi:MAG: PepSY domain-containing protein [Kangiellaceae bacterium]|nr:PepSY domain-containing protein [Kangiellaceae bacterium]